MLCREYAGYGSATKQLSETNIFANTRAYYHHHTQKQTIPPNHILLYVISLGLGPKHHPAFPVNSDVGGVFSHAPLHPCVCAVSNSVQATPGYDVVANIDRIPYVQVPGDCFFGLFGNFDWFSNGFCPINRARYDFGDVWSRETSHNNLESSQFLYRVFLRYMTL